MVLQNFNLEDFKTKTYLNFLGLSEVLHNALANLKDKLRIGGHSSGPLCLPGCALITGGNAGVGRATAEELVKRGSDVVLACRNHAAAESAAAELRQLIPYTSCPRLGSVEILDLDLASLKSVKKAVKALIGRKKVFDYIICNAGIMAPPARLETEDGLEQQFQVIIIIHIHFLISSRCI